MADSTLALAAERAERLAAVIAAVRRRWGMRALRLGAELAALPTSADLPPLSTGSLGLDLLVGGLPRGALSEVAGIDGAGAELLAQTALARCQQAGGLALLVDAGIVSDPATLARVGIDHTTLLLARPTTAVEAWGVVEAFARSDTVDLIVASLLGLTLAPGASPPVLRRGIGRVATALRGRRAAAVLVSVPSPSTLRLAAEGPIPTAPTLGGPALAQAAALRVLLTPTGPRLTPYGDVAALGARLGVMKHHGLPRGPVLPLQVAEDGIRRADELVQLGRACGIIAPTALGLALDDIVLGKTPERAAALLARTPVLADEIEEHLRRVWRQAAGAVRPHGAQMPDESGVA